MEIDDVKKKLVKVKDEYAQVKAELKILSEEIEKNGYNEDNIQEGIDAIENELKTMISKKEKLEDELNNILDKVENE